MEKSKKYVVFISYSRKDKTVADWLHEKLEHYVLPDKEKANSIFPFEGKYFRPVFLDTQDLHVEERPFNEKIKTAIENSSFLIVLCSRRSAVSPFVNKEIRYFLDTHENNLSRVVPLFLDEVDSSIPPAFEGTTIMQRHFPIYNTHLSVRSEANNYCFFQVISYILKLNFSDIYNRYEVSEEKTRKRKRNILLIIISFLATIFILLLGAFFQYRKATTEALENRQKLLRFEKKVFPAAVVHGYERNFLTPVINYLKENEENFNIYILMPLNERDLRHQDRVGDFAYIAKKELGIDSIPFVFLPTETKRGSRIMRISKNGAFLNGAYVDFATTTTSFLDIAEFKKGNPAYRNTSTDSIIYGYAHEFVDQVNKKLDSDSIYVKFFFNKFDFINELKKRSEMQDN